MIYYILFSFVFYWYIDRVRQLRMDRDFDFIFILTAMVMFVLCPLSWTYYMVFLIWLFLFCIRGYRASLFPVVTGP